MLELAAIIAVLRLEGVRYSLTHLFSPSPLALVRQQQSVSLDPCFEHRCRSDTADKFSHVAFFAENIREMAVLTVTCESWNRET